MKIFFKSILNELNYMRQKLGILILIFLGIPFLATWITGAYYHEYVNDVPIAVMDQDNSSLSRKIIQYFNDNERFTVAYYVDTKEELKQLIDEKKVRMGLYMPPHLYDKIKEGQQAQVLILLDQTNVIVGNNVYAGAAQIIQSVSAGAAMEVVEGKESILSETASHVIVPIQFNERVLYDPKMTYMNYLMYGIFTIFLQSLMLSAMADLIIRNPEEVAKEHTFSQLAAKIVVCGTLLISVGGFSIFLIHKKFGLIYNSNIKVALLMSCLYAVAISVPAIILMSIVKKKTRYTQIVYCLSLPTFFTCGYVWPLAQMPKALVMMIKVVWPLVYFARPFDEVMLKHLPLECVKGDIVGLLLYGVIGLPFAVWCFKKGFATCS